MGSTFDILGGAQRGGNLFHSFDSFSIGAGQVANFQLPQEAGIENVVSRVTGGSLSTINGTIQSRGSANLFLINPNGIVFGPNAVLNVMGSFLGSTASTVTFADGAVFHATASQPSPLLTMSAPVGLKFSTAPGSITNQSNATPNGARTLLGEPIGLQVKPNRTLALVGGAVISEGGNLTAGGSVLSASGQATFQGGRIEVGSVGSGVVGISAVEQGWALDYADVENYQAIRLGPLGLNPSSINANGANGTVRLNGQDITLTNATIFSFTTGSENGGFLEIAASETVRIDGEMSALFSQVGFDGSNVSGRGGDIRIKAQSLLIRGGVLSTGTISEGDAGDISINASELVDIAGVPGIIDTSGRVATSTVSSGDSGVVSITTPQLTIRSGSNIIVQSFGSGSAGAIDIFANKLTVDQGNLTAATLFSNGGNINLHIADLLLLRNGSQITATAGMEGGMGNGGNISIDSGIVFALPDQDSDITASASFGNGGDITINTQGLFGLAERQAVPGNGTNDIDASSDFGLAGGVEIDTLTSDPDSGLRNLPESVSDPSQKIAVGCAAQQGNRFVVAGRGGVPPTPQEPISNQQTWKDVRDLSAFRTSKQKSILPKGYVKRVAATPSIIEATGWQRNAQGQMELVNLQPSLHAAGAAARTC